MLGLTAVVAVLSLCAPAKAYQGRSHVRQPSQRSLSSVGAIHGLSLINAQTNTKVVDLMNGTIVNVSSIAGMTAPSFNINATVDGIDIQSVRFGHNQRAHYRLENYSWYTLCGNNHSTFSSCSVLGLGPHVVTATPYSKRHGEGTAGPPYTVSFSILQDADEKKTKEPSVVSQPVFTLATIPAETLAPTVASALVDLKLLSPMKVNVTSGPATVKMQVTIQKDVASPIRARLQANNPSHYVEDTCIVPTDETGLGACNITLVFSEFSDQGNYTLIFVLEMHYEIEDYWVFEEEAIWVFEEEAILDHTIEVVNSNGDGTPPTILSIYNTSSMTVNVTTTSATVEVEVVVRDDQSGFGGGYMEVIDPDGAYYIHSDATHVDFGETIAGPTTVTFSLPIPLKMLPGKYALTLYLSDKNGNSISLLDGDLAKEYPAFASMIEVIDANFEDTYPMLLDVKVLPGALVNVSSAPANVLVQLVARDNESGVARVQVIMAKRVAPDTDDDFIPIVSESLYFDQPLANQDVIVNVSLTIPQYIAVGRYTLAVYVHDGYQNAISNTSSQQAGIPPINVIASIEDDEPPQLRSLIMTNPKLVVNPSSNSNAITVYASVQDDISGVATAYVTAEKMNGSIKFEVPATSIIANSSLEASRATVHFNIPFDQTKRPGNYTVHVSFQDFAGNWILYDSNGLNKLGFPNVFEVTNPQYDSTPPTLVGFRILSALTVDVSTASSEVELELVVRDNVSGFKNGSIELLGGHSNNISETRFASESMTNLSASFNVSLSVPRYLKSGVYSFSVQLHDFAGNQASMILDVEHGYPYSIDVVNSATQDVAPPELVQFTALSPLELELELDVSSDATVTFEVVAQDDLSGLAHGVVTVYPDDNDDFYTSSEVFFAVPVSGQAVPFNVSVTFESSFPKGSYSLIVELLDATSQSSLFFSNDLIARGFPGRVRLN